MKRLFTHTLSFVIIFILSVFAASTLNAQRHYEELYAGLRDSVFYPKIKHWDNQQQYDSMVHIADKAFETFYKSEQPEQAIYLFFTAVHHPSGTTLNERVMPKIEEKLNILRQETDTLNPHFATLLQLQGFGFKYNYKMAEAITRYYTVEDILKQIDAPELLIYSLYQSMGSTLTNLGKFYESYEYLKKTLPVFKKENMLHDLSFSYLEIARALNHNNQHTLAYEFEKKAHIINSTNFPDSYNNIVVASNLANTCLVLKKFEESLEYNVYADSCMKAQEYTDQLFMVYFSILANKGIAYKELGEYEKADENFRELEKQVIKYTGTESPILADVYPEFAYNFLKCKQADSALFYLNKTRSLKPDFKEYPVYAAEAHSLKGDYEKSIRLTEKYLAEIEQTDSISDNYDIHAAFKTSESLAEYYTERYRSEQVEKYLDKAMYYILKSDTLLRDIRNALLIGGDDEKYAEAYHQLTENALEIFFLMSEYQKPKYKNYMLPLVANSAAFKLNTEAGEIREYNPNIQAQIELQQKIRRIENELLALNDMPSAEKQDLEELLFETRFEAFESAYHNQRNARQTVRNDEFNMAEQRSVKDQLSEGHTLLLFFIGEDALYTIRIDKDEHRIIKTATGNGFETQLNTFYRHIKTASPQFNESSASLYQALIDPITEDHTEINHLTIIPDGMLNRIPFEALVCPNGKFLIEKIGISYHYSLPLWMKAETSQKRAKSFLGVAPVFSKESPDTEDIMYSYSPSMRSAYSDIFSDNKLQPLPYSAEEIKSINEILSAGSIRSKTLLYDEANEATLKKEIGQYDIVHIATHGISSYESPKFSGLFLNSGVPNGDVTNDGFLYAGEIYTLNINADLVVLSACKSGAGQIRRGEGVMALPRPFIFNNVPNLVASLWKIHDEKTMLIMKDFYTHIAAGDSYTTALQKAKINSIKRGDLPFDWAALILIGK